MFRAGLFTAVGVVWLANSLNRLRHPDNQHPESASDWFSVLSFTTGLLLLALALPILASLIDGRPLLAVSLVPAAGAALAGLSNLLEDGVSMGWAFWPFILGSLVPAQGRSRPRRRPGHLRRVAGSSGHVPRPPGGHTRTEWVRINLTCRHRSPGSDSAPCASARIMA